MAFKVHRQLVVRAARMQDHRQIKALCQLKLRIQHRLLTFKLRIITIQIQTNFANRHHLLRTGCEQLLKSLGQLAVCSSMMIGCSPSAA